MRIWKINSKILSVCGNRRYINNSDSNNDNDNNTNSYNISNNINSIDDNNESNNNNYENNNRSNSSNPSPTGISGPGPTSLPLSINCSKVNTLRDYNGMKDVIFYSFFIICNIWLFLNVFIDLFIYLIIY